MSRKSAPSDSLDLLLDTICNTFGGILFLAMLVAILTNQVSRDAEPSSPTTETTGELRKLRSELVQSDARLTKLRQAVRQKEDLERRFASPESLGLLESIRSLDESSDDQLKGKTEQLAKVAESQADLEEAAREMARLAQLMADAEEGLKLAKQKLKNETSLRSRTSQIPRQHETRKSQIPFFLKAGRLCAYVRRDENGDFVHNEEETSIVEGDEGVRFLEPIADAGLEIAEDGSNAAEIKERLDTFDKSKHFLSIYVFQDSFTNFEPLKNEIIRSGFEYHLVPFPDDGKVSIGNQTERIRVQ